MECLESVLIEIKHDREKAVSDRDHWGLTKEEECFFQCEKDEYRLAENMCAVYYPFAQKLDPLRGKIKKEKRKKNSKKEEKKSNTMIPFFGACYGHVLLATQEVEKSGKNLLLPRYDKETLIKFWSHDNEHLDKQHPAVAKKIIRWDILADKFKQNEAIAHQVEELFDIIISEFHKEFIYGVAIKKPYEFGHLSQIRYISFTQEIEYNDSNLGIFIFPTLDIFNYWFTHHILSYFPLNTILTLSLIQLGVQPYYASSSIPTSAIKYSQIQYVAHDDYTQFDILRESIYRNIQLIAEHHEIKKTSTMYEIHDLMAEYTKYPITPYYALLPALLKKISARCEKNNTSESGRFFRRRSVMANELYIILKKIKNPRDKELLSRVNNELNMFIKQYKIQKNDDQKKQVIFPH